MPFEPAARERATRDDRVRVLIREVDRELDELTPDAVAFELLGHFGVDECEPIAVQGVVEERDRVADRRLEAVEFGVVDDGVLGHGPTLRTPRPDGGNARRRLRCAARRGSGPRLAPPSPRRPSGGRRRR